MRERTRLVLVGLVVSSWMLSGMVFADGGVTYRDIVNDEGSGLVYERTPSTINAIFDELKERETYTVNDLPVTPIKARGAPGVAIFDYDLDGDLDIYVTNGPATDNSLFSNQLRETNMLSFVDVGAAAGVGAADQDSAGVCYGDVDNDGDQDLYVLGRGEPNRMFENQGDGSFTEITDMAGVGAGAYTSVSCSFGDVNGDGLLDLAVGNNFDWVNAFGLFVEPFAVSDPNFLFVNNGGNVFTDVSEASGFRTHSGFPPGLENEAGVTWAVSMVDYDLDGDVDIMVADDQGQIPTEFRDGVDRGFIHLFENDGAGNFTDRAEELGLRFPGGWMGFAFGDYNCDRYLDFFSTNFGSFNQLLLTGGEGPILDISTTWAYGSASGEFEFYNIVDTLITTPFGWGVSSIDYDNDGDLDVVYQGGMDLGTHIEASNGGELFQNVDVCSGVFTRDDAAFANSTNHYRRTVNGVATGDLNEDGFIDIVSVSNFDMPEPLPFVPIPGNNTIFTGAGIVPTFVATENPGEFVFTGVEYPNGSLSVELSSADNGNNWVQIDVMGTVDITSRGQVNRDGIGAVVTLRRAGMGGDVLRRTMQPILGGSSYASQHSLTAHFGLGETRRGYVEVLWPGGVRNRLYTARTGERIRFPEIPCSFDGDDSLFDYLVCVDQSLSEIEAAGVINSDERTRFNTSAVQAYLHERGIFF